MSRNTLFLSPRSSKKNLGGVEKHVRLLSKELKERGHQVRELSLDEIDGLNTRLPDQAIACRFDRDVGKLVAWRWLFKQRDLIYWADLVHIHDVFWWYLPFRLLYPRKKVFTTFHGWEGECPPRISAVLQKRLAWRLSRGTIGVGKFFNKWYGVKPDKMTLGVLDKTSRKTDLSKRGSILEKIVFLGRLESVNGVEVVLEAIKKIRHKNGKAKKIKFLFVGDGSFRQEAEKAGKVTGMVRNPEKYLIEADLVIASSYLAMLEAAALAKPILAVADNPLKRDYLRLHPLSRHINICSSADELVGSIKRMQQGQLRQEGLFLGLALKTAQSWALAQTAEKLADLYEELWSRSR